MKVKYIWVQLFDSSGFATREDMNRLGATILAGVARLPYVGANPAEASQIIADNINDSISAHGHGVVFNPNSPDQMGGSASDVRSPWEFLRVLIVAASGAVSGP